MENTYIIPQASLPCQDCIPKHSLKLFVEPNLGGADRHSTPSFQGLLFTLGRPPLLVALDALSVEPDSCTFSDRKTHTAHHHQSDGLLKEES